MTVDVNGKRELPQGWCWARLGALLDEALPGFASGERDDQGVIQLRMNNVSNSGYLVWDEFIRVPKHSASTAKYELHKGDVVFNNTNSTELVGKSALFEVAKETIVYSNHFTRLRVKSDNLDPLFLALWLRQQWNERVFERICNRWIGQSAVKNDKLLALELPLPPLPEQHRIAMLLREHLAAVENARRAAQARLEAAQALPAALLREIFESQKAQGWERKKLGEVALLERGKFTPRPRNDPRYFNGSHPWIQIREVETAQKYILEYTKTLNDQGLSVSKKFPKGTLVISIAASIGALGILGFDSCMPDSLVGITPKMQLGNVEYIYYYLLFVRDYLKDIAPQMIQANINLEILNDFEIAIPSYEQQTNLALQLDKRLTNIANLNDRFIAQLAAIDAMPAALLRMAFQGEL